MNDASVTVNGVNLSNRVDSVEIQYSIDDVDITAMGATARAHAPGLRDDKITVTFLQDYGTGSVAQTLNPLVGSTGFTVVVKPISTATSSTNPSFTATCVMFSYSPLSGKVGDRSENQVEFQCVGAVVMATT